MKLKVNNQNYSAVVVKIHNLLEAENSDRLVCFPIQGMNCVLSKGSYEVGQVGVVFATECQLSPEFCENNNLYRHQELNKDDSVVGYMEDNRRVRALKLRGNVSNALFLPPSCLNYLGIDTSSLKEGDEFDSINGVEVCRKYIKVIQDERARNKTKGQTKTFQRIDNKTFPEHWSTDSYFKNVYKYDPDDCITVTVKMHGTSFRATNQKVRRKLSLLERICKRLGVKVNEYEYDTVAGSRRVIKDIKASNTHEHFYEKDLWNEWLEKVGHLIPKNWVLYGEIVGYVNNQKAIQAGYTYDCLSGQSKLYIYRITVVNEDGMVCDLGWSHIKEFCSHNGLLHVPEMWSGKFSDFVVEDWIDKCYYQEGHVGAVRLSNICPCDEGVCIRREGLSPYVTKAKSPMFLNHESKQLDTGEVDIESEQDQ